jgi:Ion channel
VSDFLLISLISMVMVIITWLITYEVLDKVWNILPRLTAPPRLRVMLIGIPIFAAHIINIWLYAGAYYLLENHSDFGEVIGDGRSHGMLYNSFEDCLYFSSVTYTSLGLGDLVPTEALRMLASTEVLSGLLMIGWTISFTFLTMERFWSGSE